MKTNLSQRVIEAHGLKIHCDKYRHRGGYSIGSPNALNFQGLNIRVVYLIDSDFPLKVVTTQGKRIKSRAENKVLSDTGCQTTVDLIFRIPQTAHVDRKDRRRIKIAHRGHRICRLAL